jgi:hypothetical protein
MNRRAAHDRPRVGRRAAVRSRGERARCDRLQRMRAGRSMLQFTRRALGGVKVSRFSCLTSASRNSSRQR